MMGRSLFHANITYKYKIINHNINLILIILHAAGKAKEDDRSDATILICWIDVEEKLWLDQTVVSGLQNTCSYAKLNLLPCDERI